LLQTLITLFGRKGKGTGSFIALLKCSSGRFGSCLEAIKGEAMIELAASQRGLRVVKIAPQSLKKTLGSAKDQKWQHRAGELFNPDGKRPNWSKGAVGAVAAAFKVAGEGPDRFGQPGLAPGDGCLHPRRAFPPRITRNDPPRPRLVRLSR
jgi:hypothetical protein